MNDGGPAFPQEHWGNQQILMPGLSIRDWFAGQALKGLLADPNTGNGPDIGEVLARRFAAAGYFYADAMLKERENHVTHPASGSSQSSEVPPGPAHSPSGGDA